MNKFLHTSIIAISLMTSTLLASNTLATVNGVPITNENINNYLEKTNNLEGDIASLESKKSQLLNFLIEKEILSKKAKEEGIENSDIYKKELEILKKDLLVRSWIIKMRADIEVSDREIEKFYSENKKRYGKPESVKVRHILLKEEKKASELLAKLSTLKGSELEENFIKLAKEHSIGPSSSNGGDLGWFSKGKMVPNFEETSFNLKVHEITKKPLKTTFGYHIIYKEGAKPAQITPLSEVKESIIKELKNRKFSTNFDKIKKELKEKATIKYFK